MPVEGAILGKQLPGRAGVFFWTNDSTELTAQEADELVKTSNEFYAKVLSQHPVLQGYVRTSLADVNASLKVENTDIGRLVLNLPKFEQLCGLLCDPGLVPTLKLPLPGAKMPFLIEAHKNRGRQPCS